jgi:hypothetical protein
LVRGIVRNFIAATEYSLIPGRGWNVNWPALLIVDNEAGKIGPQQIRRTLTRFKRSADASGQRFGKQGFAGPGTSRSAHVINSKVRLNIQPKVVFAHKKVLNILNDI